MPRDGSGVYTLPAGNPVVTNTIIASAWANTTLGDIAAQLNNVFTRDGLLGPTGPFKIVDGTVAAPGLAWNSEPGSGWFRPEATLRAYAMSGSQVERLDTGNAAQTFSSVYPRAAAGGSAFFSFSEPQGAANYEYNSFGIHQGEGYIAVGKAGTGTDLPLSIYANGLTVHPIATFNSNVNVRGSVEVGPEPGTNNALLDFKNAAGDDYDFRIAQYGDSLGWLRFAHNYGGAITRFKFEGNGSGLTFDNVDTQSGSNVIAFGWRGDARLGLRVDTNQFGFTWPIDISGSAAFLGGITAGSFVMGDACRVVGFANQDSLRPYMRQGDPTTGTLRFVIWQSYGDETVQRLALVGVNPGVNAVFEAISGNGAAWGMTINASDERMKTKIAPTTVEATPVIRAMEFIEFASKAMPEKMYRLGFSAQKLRAQVEDFATEGYYREPDEEGGEPMLTPATPNDLYILAYVAKSLQETIARIDALENAWSG